MAAENTDPDLIERDIERTQDEMGDTMQELEDRLSPRSFARSLLSDDGAQIGSEAWQVARENPVPVALIAIGAAWLFATSDAPAIRRIRDELRSRIAGGTSSGSSDLRSRSEEPAPIGPPPTTGEEFDRRAV